MIVNTFCYGGDEWIGVSTKDELKAAVKVNGNCVKILADITIIGDYVPIPSGVSITLDLNGKIVMGGLWNTGLFNNAGTLTICDRNPDGGGSIVGESNQGGGNASGGGIMNSGTLTLNSGSIRNGGTPNYGGGVCNNSSGTFIMNGGIIRDNNCNNGGGGVYNQGTFIMNNGTIMGNRSAHSDTWRNKGAGLYNRGGIFIMNGGNIVGNYTYNSGVGGVYNAENGTITINAGKATIAGNYLTDGTVFNIDNRADATCITLNGAFNGCLYFGYPTPSAGTVFGTAAEGSTGAQFIHSDDGTLKGSIDASNQLVWISAT